jgi:hypothetical protein
MRALDWIPYQRRTFVTPAFPGFVSGHSTFSRAAAEALTAFTDSPFFPGGLGEFVAPKDGYLIFENGPSEDLRLQWATYFDAADQSGQSRILGGIHIFSDDTMGRRIGSTVGQKVRHPQGDPKRQAKHGHDGPQNRSNSQKRHVVVQRLVDFFNIECSTRVGKSLRLLPCVEARIGPDNM